MSGRASGLAQYDYIESIVFFRIMSVLFARMDQGQVAVIGTRDLGRISTLIESGNQDDYLVQVLCISAFV